MSGQRGLVPSNFVEKVADESEMSLMMNGTGEGIGKMTGYFIRWVVFFLVLLTMKLTFFFFSDEIGDSSDEEETDGNYLWCLNQ